MSKQSTVLTTLILVFGLSFAAKAEELRIAGSDWPVWETARAMDKLNQLEGFDYSFEKYSTCINGFSEGTYDLTFMTLYDFIATQRTTGNGVIIAATDYSAGGDGVVLRNAITSPSRLRGQVLGLQANSISLYMAHLYLSKAGMSLNDIKVSNVKGEHVSKAFIANKKLAGIVGWNPNLDAAIGAGGHRVVTSADFPENVFDVVVVKRESLRKHRGVYSKFLKKWFAAVGSPPVVSTMASVLGISESEFSGYLDDAHLYRNAGSSLESFARMRDVAAEIQSFYSVKPTSVEGAAAAVFGSQPLDIDALFDGSLLVELSK